MPLSKSRKSKKPSYIAPAQPGAKAVRIGNPAWLVPTMLTLMIVGLLWIVVFYLAGNQVPVMKNLNNLENILVGFGFIGIGFGLATRWK
jgi:hypothetical protein